MAADAAATAVAAVVAVTAVLAGTDVISAAVVVDTVDTVDNSTADYALAVAFVSFDEVAVDRAAHVVVVVDVPAVDDVDAEHVVSLGLGGHA